MNNILRVIRCAWLIFDASYIDIFRDKSKYLKRPLAMNWCDFWNLT